MTDEVDSRLRTAIAGRLDPHAVSPRGEWFAWRPIRIETGGWAWLRRVRWMRPLGLLTEYYDLCAELPTSHSKSE